MNEHIVHYVDNRSPSLFGTILVDGIPVNLSTGITNVKLQMRKVSGSTLEVDAVAVIYDAPNGKVRYDWTAGDVDTAGMFAAWWRVTFTDGRVQDTPEFLFEIRAHDVLGNEYVSVAELKETLGLGDTTFVDADLAAAVSAASRTVDGITGRRFYTAGSETRKYTPVSADYLIVDDALSISSVTALGTALVLDTNYANWGTPISVLRSMNGFAFPRFQTNAVSVTGVFGWTPIPPAVKTATAILAARYLKRAREATFAVIGFALDGGAVRIPGSDPDVGQLLAPYIRSAMVE